jgi:hypothetical protein
LFASRLRLALWIVAAVFSIGLSSYIVYAELRTSDADRVNEYIADVNEVQRELSIEISHVSQAYQQFIEARPASELTPKLVKAERTIATLRRRVSELDPPRQAQELHEALLLLLAKQAAVAAEVTGTVEYTSELGRLVAPLEKAGVTMSRELRAASTAEEQSEIFTRYAAQVREIRGEAEDVQPPAAFAPTHRAFLRQLGETSALTRRLAAAARSGDSAAASAAADQLRTVSDPRPATRRAERAAIKAYNNRVRGIAAQMRVILRERDELSRELA